MTLKKPRRVLEAEKALAAALDAQADRSDEVARELADIAAERQRLAHPPLTGRERENVEKQRMRRENVAVTAAQRAVDRAWRDSADEYAPEVAGELEDAVAAALAANDQLAAALDRVATLRALLDDLEQTPTSWRGLIARLPNGRALTSLPNTQPGTIRERVAAMVAQARPKDRARLMASGDSAKRRRLARLAAIEAAADYPAVRAALLSEPTTDEPAKARAASW